jgi:hypothetical protein
MAIQKLTSFTKTVSDLADKPALTPTALKAQFDAAPNELKDAHNSLIDELKKTTAGDSGAKNIGVSTITGLTGNDIQTVLANLLPVSGTNTLGDYIKFPDGTMIVTKDMPYSSQGTDYYAGELTFPLTFTSLPSIFLSAYNNYAGAAVNNVNQTYVTGLTNSTFRFGVKFQASVPTGNLVYIKMMAIGRWK